MRFGLILALSCVVLPAQAAPPSHADWNGLLARYVREDGVDYASWRQVPEDLALLGTYLSTLRAHPPQTWPRNVAFAYWINFYNAATVQLVLEHPEVTSIREIEGPEDSPWKRSLGKVAGKVITLDQIEHEILRRNFGDPRLHFALNCAAKSCPPLQAAAFDADSLNAQLDAVTRRAVNDSRFVDRSRISAHGGILALSSIFQWYAGDFGDLREFLNRYLEPPLPTEFEIDYLEYDWQLNAATAGN